MSPDDPIQGHEEPRTLSLDIVVTPQSLTIWGNNTDLGCACDDTDYHFAAVDTCLDLDDVVVICSCQYPPTSCLSARIVGNGVDAMASGWTQLGFELPSPLPSDFALELGGCGHDTTRIEIPPFTPPEPTLDVMVVDSSITATWQTSQPSTSAVVGYFSTYTGRTCHTTASSHTFVWPYAPTSRFFVDVTTFLPSIDIDSALGDVRVWRGAATYMQVEPPP